MADLPVLLTEVKSFIYILTLESLSSFYFFSLRTQLVCLSIYFSLCPRPEGSQFPDQGWKFSPLHGKWSLNHWMARGAPTLLPLIYLIQNFSCVSQASIFPIYCLCHSICEQAAISSILKIDSILLVLPSLSIVVPFSSLR